MRRLGLEPTKNSGSGWIEKEDGQSEDVICQLKSTDAASIKVSKQDLDTLQYNASVSHKLPVFVLQFISSGELYLVLKPEVLEEVAKYLQTGEYQPDDLFGLDLTGHEETAVVTKRTVKSSSSAREAFKQEQAAKYKKRRSAT